MEKTSAFAWASGLIGFTTPVRCPKVPRGARLICTGPTKQVRLTLECCARHAYKTRRGQHQKLLVPGIPEASLMGYDPEEKLREFIAWVRPKIQEKPSTKEAA